MNALWSLSDERLTSAGAIRLEAVEGDYVDVQSSVPMVAILALAAIPSTVRGQAWHPFADPMEFDPDYQFFAPVDADYLEELSPRKRAHIGWFGTYDRAYTLSHAANKKVAAVTSLGPTVTSLV